MIELQFDDELSLSGSEINKEEGKDVYCYREASLTLRNRSSLGFSLDE